jgi:methionyl-tRNA formyltransferase
MKKSFPRIIFYGTPRIAVASLRQLVDEGYPVAAVVTAPGKPAGRGVKPAHSPVRDYALSTGLTILQPESMKDPRFLETLRSLNPDLQVVVAFRMMPREVWSLPPMGTFNLHASLLPDYRGAAPINWVIIRGERETGVTTFFLDDKIDTGEIIFMEKTPIDPFETAGELHDRLMQMGALLVSKTVRAIAEGKATRVSQAKLADPSRLKTAPKFTRDDARIDWSADLRDVFNLVRGMSPYPGAVSDLRFPDSAVISLKILKASPEPAEETVQPGSLVSDGRTFLKVAVRDGFLSLLRVQPAGRKAMGIVEFLNGFGRHFHQNP